MALLSQSLIDWLTQHADNLDQSANYADELLNKIAQDGIFRFGVPTELGGDGSSIQKAIEATSELAEHSLTAAFIAWGHRTFIDSIIYSDNPYPRQQWLAKLLNGELSAASGQSNAVKFLSGFEKLQVSIREQDGKAYLNGKLPWVTNLRRDGFLTVFAADYEDNSRSPIIIAIPSNAQGLTRSNNLSLVALRGSNTAALTFENVELDPNWIIHTDAVTYFAQARPAFLGLQCGMAFGLAKRSLSEVEKTFPYYQRNLLKDDWQAVSDKFIDLQKRLFEGLSQENYFVTNPKALFQIRIDIVDVVSKAVLLELEAGGGRGYLENSGSTFIRRWREAAFLPVVTPSVVQLKLVLEN